MIGLEYQAGLWEMVVSAGWVVKFVLFILFLQSTFSWAIILYKLNFLRKAEKETKSIYELFSKNKDVSQTLAQSKNYAYSPVSRLLQGVWGELGTQPDLWSSSPKEEGYRLKTDEASGHPHEVWVGYAKRTLEKLSDAERAGMEKSLNFLATTASSAPFIGLFGTVWGIMDTFMSIGIKGAANITVVAPGIAEALIATAIGLFAAIPAVIGYNHILSRIDRLAKQMESFSIDIINLIEKNLSRPGQ